MNVVYFELELLDPMSISVICEGAYLPNPRISKKTTNHTF